MQTLTLARDLLRRKARERNGLFVAEGVRTVEALLRSGLKIDSALTCELLDRTPRGAELAADLVARGVPVNRVSEREFLSASGTDNPQGILAVAVQPKHTLESLAPGAGARYLVLDAVQDPGNVGTLLRTAAALGVAATIVLPGTADPWNAKVVRSAVGLQFTHPTVEATEPALLGFLKSRGVELWGADATGEAVGQRAVPSMVALAVGNEGAGLTRSLCDACAARVAIAMAAGVESLNVAVAAGILLHALRPTSTPS
jgi:TrmH family RNA methyltransferase